MRSAARRRTVESLLDQLELLTRERQQLRDDDAASAELEDNRLAIVETQWALSHALIDRHRPAPPRAA